MKIVICFIMIEILTVSAMANQVGLMPIPVFTNAGVQAVVTYNSTRGFYTYTYTITNSAVNTGKIWAIAIDISQPSNSVTLSSEGLTIPLGGEAGNILTFEEEFPSAVLNPIPMIPVGMSVPYGWGGGLTPAGIAHIAVDSHTFEILSGQTLGGFEIISRGLPTIREVKIEPWWIYVQSEALTVEEAQQEDQRAREIESLLPFKTKTLGPTAPPADFKPISFIDYIITVKHEAFSLGWITNQGVEQSLDAKLDNAKMKITQGNANAAKNILEAFINEVEAQKDKYLTSEAYGLLKYNVEYLIGRL